MFVGVGQNLQLVTNTTTPTPITVPAGQTITFNVPAGVPQATFTVVGGNGGRGYVESGYESYQTFGGLGGVITNTRSVNAGETYYCYAGNNGNTGSTGAVVITGGLATTPSKFGTGGNTVYAGGGGSVSAVSYNTTSNFIIVAGGGGGGGEPEVNAQPNTGKSGRNANTVTPVTSGILNSTSNGASTNQYFGAGGGGVIGGVQSLGKFGNAGSSLVPVGSTFTSSTGTPSITINYTTIQLLQIPQIFTYSYDGSTWNIGNNYSSIAIANSVCSNGNKYIAVGSNIAGSLNKSMVTKADSCKYF
jgi:hypothetical protein